LGARPLSGKTLLISPTILWYKPPGPKFSPKAQKGEKKKGGTLFFHKGINTREKPKKKGLKGKKRG